MKKSSLSLWVLIFFCPWTLVAQKVEDKDGLYGKVSETFAQLDKANAFTDNLSHVDMNVLPIGLKQTISNNEFTIAISDVRLLETHAELTVFARMKIPENDQLLFFGAQGVKFSYTGSFMGDASLVLMHDVEIPVNKNLTLTLKGGFSNVTGTGSDMTSVSIECLGFKELSVSGELRFSNSILTKVNTSNKPVKEPVTASFRTVIRDWNDLLVDISLPAFQVTGLDGFVFRVNKAVFDFSDYRNGKVTYPTGYKKKYLVSGSEELWRGVFVEDLSLTFPEEFSKKDGERPSFQAHHLLIDRNGVSGEFVLKNVLPIEFGDASGWAFSVNDFMLTIAPDENIKVGFAGQIGLPVSENGTLLNYDAVIGLGNQYTMTVALNDSLSFDFLSAKAVLKKNSYVKLEVKDGKFKPEASLNGYLDIHASVGESARNLTKLENIEFEQLVLKTEMPYLKIGYLGYKGSINMFGFPLSVSNISLNCPGNKANLGFDLALNLDGQFVSATTRLEIAAEYKQKNAKYFWVGDGLKLAAVKIKDCDIGGVMKLSGSLEILDNHPLYGTGFSGDINLEFQKVVQGLKISTAAAFGRKDDFRYWFVDGTIGLPGSGIPIGGVLNLRGFGGGMSYSMRKVIGEGLGLSKTGCGYMPDGEMGLGLKAAVMFGATSGSMEGDASFEISFNRHGGLQFVGFYGYVEFMAHVPILGDLQNKLSGEFNKLVDMENSFVGKNKDMMNKLERWKQFSPNEAAKVLTDAEVKAMKANMAASLGIQYDVSAKTLHANFDFYMNVAGGLIRGVGSGNRAGQAVLHISPSKWYLHLGRPDDRIGLEIGIPGLLSVTSGSYFMMGDDLPGSPPPPLRVAKILGVEQESLDYMRDLNALQAGRGLAFGSDLSVSTGEMRFLILYASFNAGIGFDIMVKDYGDIQCSGRSGPIGINGWYANGQAYAYLDGEMGVMVNLWFVKGKFPILKTGIAALLQTQLPNPFWMRGNVAADFNLLGGLVKGNMRFKFSVGEKCELQYPGGSPVAMSMISDLKPVDGVKDLDVFSSPQLALSLPANKEFVVSEEDTRYYRIQLNEFAVYDGNQSIRGKLKWNKNQDVVTFESHEVLPPHKELRLKVRVGFEEKINGYWQVVSQSGVLSEETREITFTTGDVPNYIAPEHITYAYPVVDQQYFLPDESRSGYVTLNRGRSDLLTAGWNFTTRILKGNELISETDFRYDSETKTLFFDLPKIDTQQQYQLNFVAQKESSGSLEGGEAREVTLLDQEDSQVTQTMKEASDVVSAGEGKDLLTYSFASSRYQSFKSKIKAYQKKYSTTLVLIQSMPLLMYQTEEGELEEPFEDFEVAESSRSGGIPLIDVVAVPDNEYYQEDIYPLLYESHPYKGHRKEAYGEDLLRAIGLDDNPGSFPYSYHLPLRYFNDYTQLRSIAENEKAESDPLRDATKGFPAVRKGKYNINLRYFLPGQAHEGNSKSSSTFYYTKKR